jgi:hypothetical protein
MKIPSPLGVVAFVTSATLTTACLNLDDVATLTKTADSAQQVLPAVVRDWPLSCERLNVLVRNIPEAERPPTMRPQDCAPYTSVSDRIAKNQAILIAYFDALGKLSSNKLFTFDTQFDASVAAIGSLPGLSQKVSDATSAAEKLGKALAGVITEGYRSSKVNGLITTTDDAVHTLTADLKDIVSSDYALQLANESSALDAFYLAPMAAAARSERLSLILVQRQYSGDARTLASRQRAAQHYGTVMDDLAALHRALKADIVKKASLKEMAGAIAPYVSGLSDAIGAIRQEIR